MKVRLSGGILHTLQYEKSWFQNYVSVSAWCPYFKGPDYRHTYSNNLISPMQLWHICTQGVLPTGEDKGGYVASPLKTLKAEKTFNNLGTVIQIV